MSRPGSRRASRLLAWCLPGLAAIASPAVPALDYGLGVAGGGGTEVDLMGQGRGRVKGAEVGLVLDTAREGRVLQDRLSLSVARSSVTDVRVERDIRSTDPSASPPTDVPVEADCLGAMLTNSVRFVIAPGRGGTFWMGPTLYGGYFRCEDPDGAGRGGGTYAGIGPSVGVDARLPSGRLLVELALRVGEHEALDVDVMADETVVRLGWLFGH